LFKRHVTNQPGGLWWRLPLCDQAVASISIMLICSVAGNNHLQRQIQYSDRGVHAGHRQGRRSPAVSSEAGNGFTGLDSKE
jgi:hypothetical protein